MNLMNSSNFENFLNGINKRKLYLSTVTGNFNLRSSSWCSRDTATIERLKLISLKSSNGLSQLINEPTHIQTNRTSFVNLIFTDQENVCVNAGVHSPLHLYCTHQIIYSSFNFSIYYPPLPPSPPTPLPFPTVSMISMGLQKG